MQVLKRAKGRADGELVPFNADEKELREEVNRRTARAGFTTRLGEPNFATKCMGTKTWGNEKLNVWPRDKEGNLIDDT